MARTGSPINIGSKLELFADDFLIDRHYGADLTLHRPTPQNVALAYDQPWEGNSCGEVTVFQDGELYRMYYRGSDYDYVEKEGRPTHPDVVCYAESRDGISWTRPSLNLVEFEGSADNNIIWDAVGSKNFVPFKDANPGCERDAAYKALGGVKGGLHAFKSPDGIHWSLMSDDPVITRGFFDSQNLAFWDTLRGEYREYHRDFRDIDEFGGRDFRNGRDIMTGTSKDFLTWSEPVWLEYSPGRINQLYTNQVIPYYRAPHIFLGFPMRYVDRGWTESTKALPQLEYRRVRASSSQREGTAVTDGMFMTSRDGLQFDIWPESFIRPGLRLKENWFYGDNYQNWGIVETESAIEGAPRELSVYASEASHQADSIKRLRRFTLRIDGFVSVQAKLSGGEFVTAPLVFEGSELTLNFSTSAAGSIRVEIQDTLGMAINGFSLVDCHEIFGDDLARLVSWSGGEDLGQLAGRPVRLRFVLKDADLYSLRFR